MQVKLAFGASGTLSPAQSFGVDRLKLVPGTVSFDSSYPPGGEELDLSSVFPERLAGIKFEPCGGYVFEYDHENKKVKVLESDGEGPLVETSTTDLSALVDVPFLAWGY